MTEQPTEQWVQRFLWLVTVAPGGGGGPPSALRMPLRGKAPSAARLPELRPERRRKARRSRPREVWSVWAGTDVPWLNFRSGLFLSTGCALTASDSGCRDEPATPAVRSRETSTDSRCLRWVEIKSYTSPVSPSTGPARLVASLPC